LAYTTFTEAPKNLEGRRLRLPLEFGQFPSPFRQSEGAPPLARAGGSKSAEEQEQSSRAHPHNGSDKALITWRGAEGPGALQNTNSWTMHHFLRQILQRRRVKSEKIQ